MWVVALAIAIALIILWFRPSALTEALTAMGLKGVLPGWSALDLHGYTNNCLTKTPYGFPSHQGIYQYWKDRPKSWATEYSEERVRGNIDNVRSSEAQNTAHLGSEHAPAPAQNGPDPRYYHSGDNYCKENPNKYPCPNNWAENGHVRTHISGDMSKPVPGMIQGVYGHVHAKSKITYQDSEIDDNYHMRIINTGREDHGLCGGNDTPRTEIYH
jgi:hypothetical protein